MKPSVGRVVHYVSYGTPGGEYGKECRAAIVTEVQDDPRTSVGLCVLNPTGQFFNRAVPYDDSQPERAGGTWHWPEHAPQGDAPQVHVNADLSTEQTKAIVAEVQAKLLQQAKRNRQTGRGLKPPGLGA